MDHAISTLQSIIGQLFGLNVAVLGSIRGALRSSLTQVGVTGQAQSLVLVVVSIVLIVAAFRVFGRLFALLIAVLLILLVVNGVVPGPGR